MFNITAFACSPSVTDHMINKKIKDEG